MWISFWFWFEFKNDKWITYTFFNINWVKLLVALILEWLWVDWILIICYGLLLLLFIILIFIFIVVFVFIDHLGKIIIDFYFVIWKVGVITFILIRIFLRFFLLELFLLVILLALGECRVRHWWGIFLVLSI